MDRSNLPTFCWRSSNKGRFSTDVYFSFIKCLIQIFQCSYFRNSLRTGRGPQFVKHCSERYLVNAEPDMPQYSNVCIIFQAVFPRMISSWSRIVHVSICRYRHPRHRLTLSGRVATACAPRAEYLWFLTVWRGTVFWGPSLDCDAQVWNDESGVSRRTLLATPLLY
jgi:hypothetical protein